MKKTTDPRDGLMAALSVAEQLAASAPVAPVGIYVNPGELDIHFNRAPEAVVAFAEQHSLSVSMRREHSGTPRPYLSADGRVEGLRVHVWSLGDAGDEAEYEAALTPVSLPSAWSAAAVSA